EFRENDSVLYDEIIAHRLAMISLKTDLKSYEPIKDCKCEGEGCARCTCTLSLKEKGPKMVYASDLKSNDPKVKAAYPETPIVNLLKDQKLEFIGTAVLNTGNQHIKWSPGTSWYHYNPKITIKNDEKLLTQFKDKFPPQAFKAGKLDAQQIRAHNLYDACEDICEGLVKIDWEDKNIVFNVESWGHLSPEEIITKACDVIDVHLDKFTALLK
ncbi:MAG: DNA-directed RNA polymerase subunit D, partial [Nanoarchaeota archaeon]|nr:DNA-directed RNA polymerase subunit D [Nanoarchaeota archaeon]